MLARLVREPLVHFLTAGLALYALAEWHARASDPRRIVLSAAVEAQLKSAYEAEFGMPPAAAVMPRLIEDYVTSEVRFREGIARGLDRSDEIIRRRIIQKVEFLEADLAVPDEPSKADLRSWYDRHRANYTEGGRVDFSHVFFAADAAGDSAAKARAEAVRARLGPDTIRAPELGDSFPDLADFAGFSPAEAQRLFGDGEMAGALFKAPVGRWSGPWRSAFGWHLVRVSAARPGTTPGFEQVRERVKADWLAAARAAANADRMAQMRAGYTVVRE